MSGDFVGRERLLGEVDELLPALHRGRGGLLVVTGEPGIGKTRLCEEITERAERFGSVVKSASCWQSGSAAVWWPWKQLLGQLVTTRPGLLDELGAERSWILAVLGEPAGGSTAEPETARVEVAGAVLSLLRSAGQAQPTLLVLDDLHWADEPSLRVLAAVAPALRSMPVLLAVAYRDAEMDPPLADLHPQLLRHGWVMPLEALAPAEVAQLVAGVTGEYPAPAVVDTLYRRTGGNPLFTRELVRFGIGAGDALPPTVVAALGARIGRLSDRARELLTLAALAGDEFTLDVLMLAGGSDRDELMVIADEAVAARLLEQVSPPDRFRFTHALARDAALEGVGLARRVRLHAALGAALEQLRDRGVTVDVAGLAFHFAASAAEGHRAKAIGYSVEAADDAARRTAYEDAVRLLRRAVELLRLDPAATDRTELLLRLADAELAAGAMPRARDAYLEAAACARDAGQVELLARAALGVGGGGGFEVALADREQVDLLEEALGLIGPDRPALRSRLCGRLSIAVTYGEGRSRRLALAQEAVELARESDDGETLAWALASYCDAISGPDRVGERVAVSAEVVSLARARRDRRLELLGRRLRAMALLEAGEVGGFDDEVDAYAAVASTLRQPLYEWFVPLWQAMRAGMAGRFDEAEHLQQEALARGTQAASANAVLLGQVQAWCLLADMGRRDESLAHFSTIDDPSLESTTVFVARALSHAVAGHLDTARALLDEVAERLSEIPVDAEWLVCLCQAAVTVEAIGGHPVGGWLYESLLPYAEQFAVEGIGAWCRGNVHEFLGLLAHSAGRTDDAQTHFRAAVARNEAVGATVAAQRARSRLAPGRLPAIFRRSGDAWELAWQGTQVRVRDRKGLHDLARLLSMPGRAISAAELAGVPVVEGAGDPVLDEEARKAYARRLQAIDGELDESDRRGDTVRSARLAEERTALMEQLQRAVGLGGRARRLGGSSGERARSTVTQRIRDTLRHLDGSHPALADHLRSSVRTGTLCIYEPTEPVDWGL